jgi:uncharacterized small protein (DUF1192 family)
MSEQIVETLQAQRKYPEVKAPDRELQLKNENLQRYVTELLTRNATLNAEIRKLEGVRR